MASNPDTATRAPTWIRHRTAALITATAGKTMATGAKATSAPPVKAIRPMATPETGVSSRRNTRATTHDTPATTRRTEATARPAPWSP